MVDIHVNDKKNQIKINVSPTSNSVSSTIGNEVFYNGLAKEWAISENLVQGIDYSAKHYAGQAKQSEETATEAISHIGTSVEEAAGYAQNAANSADAAALSAQSAQSSAEYVVNNAPTATVSKSGKVSTLTVTDLNGTTTTEILDGADGSYTLPIASSNTLGGVKIGNNLSIDANGVLSAATGGTVDQTYSPNSANAQSGIAIAGAKFLQNTATSNGSITVNGTATAKSQAINIGTGSQATGNYGTALGAYSFGNANHALGLGNYAKATADYAIQLNKGTNNTSNSLCVGFNSDNYQLLDGTTGLIPDARISTNIARTSQIPSAVTESTVSGWGFTKNVGTVTSVNNIQPDTNGNVTISTRNVGEVITSTLPLTDAGLHLLDGSLLQYGIYQEFIDYIADLYAENPTANYFTDETTWQASVTQYGSCGKFVYDSVSKTVRLPKISDILQSTTDINALGDLIEAGLPNITGLYHSRSGADADYSPFTNHSTFANNSALYHQTVSTSIKAAQTASSTYSDMAYLAFDASRSSSIYGNSDTVQPQSIKVLYYIVVANSTKTSIQVDIDNIATDLNGKADTDLANVTDTGKILMSEMGMPSDKYIDLTLGASGSSYTAPANGWFYVHKTSSGSGQYLTISGKVLCEAWSTGTGQDVGLFIPVKKGVSISISYSLGGSTKNFKFVYAQGSESEAN